MKGFFKIVFASMVGVILSVIVVFVLGIAIITAIVSSSSGDSRKDLTANTILHVNLSGPISERTSKSPFDNINFPGFDTEKNVGLNDILAGIKNAKTDDNIDGIYLDVSSVQAGFATIEEIRNALIDFKKSKKFLIAYSEVYTQGAYYLASVSDKIYLNPEGALDFRGLSTEMMFFKGMMEKLDIEPQIIKVGTFKSAVEPFVREDMSEANRLQVTSFLGSMYDHFLTEISASRNISKDSLFSYANEGRIRNAEDAKKYKMVDALKYKDEVLDELKLKTDIEKDKDLKSVVLAEYGPDVKERGPSSNRIALIYATGEITTGEGSDEVIGSEKISRTIRKARLDDKVKAVVFRVNSPGGSALASDVIWREIVLTKKVKPVIVSMGDVAASGGYYIACAADSIFAEPNTITGSIGVFGIIPNMQKFFNNKLGITFDGVKTGKYADLGTVSRPLTDGEKMIIQSEVNKIYDTFTKKVAQGRNKEQSYINEIGQGRVWSGTEALKIGLVDKLGNINDAVNSAAKKAKLKADDYKIVEYPAQKDPFQSIFSSSTDKVQAYFTKMELGDHYTIYQKAKAAIENTGIQARMPYEFIVK